MLSVDDTINAVNPALQGEMDAMWLKRRVGGAVILTSEHTGFKNAIYDIEEDQKDNLVIGKWYYVIGIIVLVIVVLSQRNCLLWKRYFHRKRIVAKIRRAIQVITMQR